MTLIAMKMGTVIASRSIAGWGVVPRMTPPPSQGGSTLGERERERERKRDDKRERERFEREL